MRKRSATMLAAPPAVAICASYRKCKCGKWVDSRGDAASLCSWCSDKMKGISPCDNCGKTYLDAEMALCKFDPRAGFFWYYCNHCYKHVLEHDEPKRIACCGMHSLELSCDEYNTIIPGVSSGSNARREHNQARALATETKQPKIEPAPVKVEAKS